MKLRKLFTIRASQEEKRRESGLPDYRFLNSRQCNSRADTFRFSMIRLTRYRSVIGERTKGRRWKVPRRRPQRTMAEVGAKGSRREKRLGKLNRDRWDHDWASISFISNGNKITIKLWNDRKWNSYSYPLHINFYIFLHAIRCKIILHLGIWKCIETGDYIVIKFS